MASTIRSVAASRPWPTCPDAKGPTSGSTIRAPSSRSLATLRRVAGCAYISPSIAGATTSGAFDARHVAVMTSSVRPFAIAAIQRAVAGATTIASAVSAATM
jgi:hypothetical protein